MIQRAVFLACVALAVALQYQIHGSWRTILSGCVTFSNQVVVLMAAWQVVDSMYPLPMIQDMLLLYGVVIGVVFYGLIIPMVGLPDMTVVQVCDFMVHMTLPALFYLQWYAQRRPLSRFALWQFLAYPALYWMFVLWVSHRRGYAIYPFLYHPVALAGVIALFVGLWWYCTRLTTSRVE